jgi:hypothetical protein
VKLTEPAAAAAVALEMVDTIDNRSPAATEPELAVAALHVVMPEVITQVNPALVPFLLISNER